MHKENTFKEIGAYFELELALKEEYHKDAIKLNSARNAFKYILKAQNISKVYMPSFFCLSMFNAIEQLNIQYETYNINEQFEIKDFIHVKDSEKIIYVNYFGTKSKYIQNLVKLYNEKLIIDNSHAFFEKHIPNIDTIYSPRKFFGVSDGGYLYTKYLLDTSLKDENIMHDNLFLLGRINSGASAYYNSFLKSEERLNIIDIHTMSALTKRILSSIDYVHIEKIRKENFLFLHQKLSKYNTLRIDLDNLSVPFVYPFMTKDITLRKKLIDNKIYISSYWKDVLSRESSTQIEKDFVTFILPLPIDQRYNNKDMQRIIEVINL